MPAGGDQPIDRFAAHVVADDTPLLGNEIAGHFRTHGAEADESNSRGHSSSEMFDRIYSGRWMVDEFYCAAPTG